MGVDGLIKFLQSLLKKQHISTFKGQTAAVDIMSWIYKACYNSAQQMRSQKQSLAFLQYLHQMIDLLQHYNITTICVFDGRFLPHKQNTINKRKNIKEENLRKGQQLLEKGQQEESKKYLNRCININEHIFSTTMKALKGRSVQFMVAPYEADAQIAKLYNLSLINFAICQDSDLIVYGVPVVLKLSNEGDCDYLNINQEPDFAIESVFVQQFIMMDKFKRTDVAVLTGTDYLPSIKGIGIKKSVKFVAQSQNLSQVISKVKQIQRFKAFIPQNYQEKALQARLIFCLATTYNPISQVIEFLDENYAASLILKGVSYDKLKQIAGIDYGYDKQVCNGYKHAWLLASRDLTEIQYNGNSTILESVLRQKQISLQNSKILRSQKINIQPLFINKEQIIEEQLIEMCQSKQLRQKKQSIKKLQKLLQQICQKDQKDHQIQLEDDKLTKFKQRFPEWMEYRPITQTRNNFPTQ